MRIGKLIIIFILTLAALPASLIAGELSFEVIPSSQHLSVGDTLTLTMKVIVYGMPERYEVEPMSKLELPGFTTVSTSPRHRRGIENGETFEERITTFKMIAEEPGEHTIPSFEIPYHADSQSENQYLTSQELQIVVKPAPAGLARSNAPYIVGIFILVILISVGGFYLWLRRTKSKQFAEEEDRNIEMKFKNWADELSKLLASGKTDTFTQQAFNYVNEFIEDNYHLGLKGKRFEKRMMIIQDKGVNLRLIELLKITHDHLEEYKFGGITHNTNELSELMDELKNIDQYIDKPKTKSESGDRV
ncbi:MAG: protein BatD [candidate division Zixibacteria bacterium]|nr:protein BatD [candidate division Zixibacteria bacterium]NIR65737.1 protein BatD [candidate division Zixibacteria bacterium]NIS16168.1 protein BatD [candidate division Zixibacteria bacterium]NIS47422.1 protein BatD [candidate division Zixibacteria bacterium]NIT52564.1 protein BatD [candidate division Zixibacteria bacterium]